MSSKRLSPGQKLTLRVLEYYRTLDESHLNFVFANSRNTLCRALYKTFYIQDHNKQMDIVQEIQIKALGCFRRQLFQVRNPESPTSIYTYLSFIMNSVVIDLDRRNKLKTVGGSVTPELWAFFTENLTEAEQPHEPTVVAEAHDLITIVSGLVQKLPAKLRESFIAIRYEGLSYIDAGLLLNINIGTVKNRLHRAKALLLEQVTELGILPPTSELYSALHMVDTGDLFGTGAAHTRAGAGYHRSKKSVSNNLSYKKRVNTQIADKPRRPEYAPFPQPVMVAPVS